MSVEEVGAILGQFHDLETGVEFAQHLKFCLHTSNNEVMYTRAIFPHTQGVTCGLRSMTSQSTYSMRTQKPGQSDQTHAIFHDDTIVHMEDIWTRYKLKTNHTMSLSLVDKGSSKSQWTMNGTAGQPSIDSW